MPKLSIIYVCSKCGAQSLKWSGRCLECGSWNTMDKEVADGKETLEESMPAAETIDLTQFGKEKAKKIETKISEVDRLLGGGITPGSLIILSGEPGIGKSTIVSQIADSVQKDFPVFYVSGEESASQVGGRFERLNILPKNIKFSNETNIDRIISAAKSENFSLIIIDSIQTAYSGELNAEPGSINQIRATASKLLSFAKKTSTAILLIGHITKDGVVAGPKSFEHLVDTVIYLEAEKESHYRILRATKNRFGSINEIGVFEITGQGFKEIKNPSSIFFEASPAGMPGSLAGCFIEGSRPFLVEIQALVSKTFFGYPQRRSAGIDQNRLNILSAVLTKRASINLNSQDIILNVVGGLKIQDPALDLAVCGAIISSLANIAISPKTIALGEIGLGGEVRLVARLEERLQEAKKLGFTQAIIPDTKIELKDIEKNIKLYKIKNAKELVAIIKDL